MKLILVHIPKTAGSAILMTYKDELYNYWGHNTRDNDFIRYPDYAIKQDRKNSIIQIFKNKLSKNERFSFAVVRNTWERVYSSYNYLTQGGLEPYDYIDFEKYIKPYNGFNNFIKNGLEKAFKEQIHFRTQLYWIADDKFDIKVDKILKFENVNEQLKVLMRQFNLTPKNLIVYNKYDSLNYKEIYNEESIKIVSEIYNQEIRKFRFEY